MLALKPTYQRIRTPPGQGEVLQFVPPFATKLPGLGGQPQAGWLPSGEDVAVKGR